MIILESWQDGFLTSKSDLDSVEKLGAELRNEILETNKDVLLAQLVSARSLEII